MMQPWNAWMIAALLCAGMAMGPPAAAEDPMTVTIRDGDWSANRTWNNGVPGKEHRVDCRTGHKTTCDKDFTIAALFGPGYGGSDTLTVASGATLEVTGQTACGIGGGEGRIVIESGAAFRAPTASGQGRVYLGAHRAGGDGKGHMIIKPKATVEVADWLQVSADAEPGDSLILEGAEAKISIGQLRLEEGAKLILRPKAAGSEGLSTIACDFLIIGGAEKNTSTGVTLALEPGYELSDGDSWVVAQWKLRQRNTFETLEAPEGWKLSQAYAGNKLTITANK